MTDKSIKYLALIIVLAILVAGNVIQYKRIEKISSDRDRYARNTSTLLSDIETYKVNDSLNAAKTQALELSLKEYQKYRAEDAALIKQLKTKNRDLQSVVTNQSEMIVEMQSAPRDTFIIRDSVKIGAKVVHCGDDWYDFDGLLTDKEFTGNMVSRDSLLIAETVKYKRFLGFLWKTKQVKNREIDVISKNPHNKIQNCEIITIE
jgi:hypothetical protein